jgi:hypothetical protein
MKIAQIAPLYEAVPPKLYGGTERIVAHLTNNYLRLYRRLCGAADTADVCRRRSTQPAVQANGM